MAHFLYLSLRFTPSWLGKHETYEDYLASGGRKGKASGSYWREEEIAKLCEMVDCKATQLEIMQEFPFRRWIQLKCRIKEIYGKETRVPLSGISQRLTYIEYVQQQKDKADPEEPESAQETTTANSDRCSEIVTQTPVSHSYTDFDLQAWMLTNPSLEALRGIISG